MESKGKKEIEVENEYIIGKLGNIYDEKDMNIRKYFEDEKKKSQLLMFSHDNRHWQNLKKYTKSIKKKKIRLQHILKNMDLLQNMQKRERTNSKRAEIQSE
jgi:hypothetical protein